MKYDGIPCRQGELAARPTGDEKPEAKHDGAKSTSVKSGKGADRKNSDHNSV